MKNSGIALDKWSPKAQRLIASALEAENKKRRTPHERTDSPDYPSSSPESERVVRNAPLEQDETPPLYSGRVSIRIVSHRKRLCDPDNLCVKAIVDCLRYSGIIANDRPEDITLHVSQEKVKTSEEERTEIVISPIP